MGAPGAPCKFSFAPGDSSARSYSGSEVSMILAGDLGGTKSNLGLFDVQNGKLVRTSYKRYASRDHAGLQEIAKDFLNGAAGKVTAASFGIAGPVVNNRVHATNLPWIIDGAAMAGFLGLGCVRLINDVEAAAY